MVKSSVRFSSSCFHFVEHHSFFLDIKPSYLTNQGLLFKFSHSIHQHRSILHSKVFSSFWLNECYHVSELKFDSFNP